MSLFHTLFASDRFAWPWAFWLLLIPALIAAWSLIRRFGAHRTGVVYSAGGRLDGIRPTLRQRVSGLPLVLRLIVLSLLIIALARPQHEMGRTKTSTEGIAMQLVIDRSGSMDEPMDFDGERRRRIDVVKEIATEFLVGNDGELGGREGDLVGIIAFASYADTIAPLTQSPELVAELLEPVEVARVQSESGTAIGDALSLALARLKRAEEELTRARRESDTDRPGERPADGSESDTGEFTDEFSIKGKAVILLTDGENNAGSITPLQAAGLAQDWGIRVYTIGIGEGRYRVFGGMRVPIGGGVDSATLSRVAEGTGGKFWLATDAEALREVYAEIDRLETTRIETQELTDYQEAFTPFAALALALLAIEVFVRTAVLRRAP
ncbi:MAG: VWA domain-containing protein [Planctomycetota bacterium]